MSPDYANRADDVEVAPRSPHHAAMLLLEQRVGQLSRHLSDLSETLKPALRPPQPEASEKSPPAVQAPTMLIAHVDSIGAEVDRCISRTQDLLDRLVI